MSRDPLTPLAPWERPLNPHPGDKERRAMWWQLQTFRAAGIVLVALLWEYGPWN